MLVAEDDRNMRELVRRTMEKDGWSVVEAENGLVALDRIAEKAPDLILLDLMMPEMDGFEFVATLRERDDWRSIPVVVITAKDLTPQDRQRLNGYVQSVLTKGPFATSELLRQVGELVATHARCEPVSG